MEVQRLIVFMEGNFVKLLNHQFFLISDKEFRLASPN